MEQTTIYDYLQPNFVQQIYNFNKQAGLLEKGYDDFLEAAFQIEEALEGFDLSVLGSKVGADISLDISPKHISRLIVGCSWNPIPDVDRLDKAIDAIVFAIGSIAKLGLNVEQIHRAIGVVTEANLQKLSMPKDEHGKLTKPANFIGPEAQLQALLDERK